jgi:hypothetical protein
MMPENASDSEYVKASKNAKVPETAKDASTAYELTHRLAAKVVLLATTMMATAATTMASFSLDDRDGLWEIACSPSFTFCSIGRFIRRVWCRRLRANCRFTRFFISRGSIEVNVLIVSNLLEVHAPQLLVGDGLLGPKTSYGLNHLPGIIA